MATNGQRSLRTLTEKGWFNALWFNVFWLLCVMGQNPLLPLTTALLLIHCAFSAMPRRELSLLLSTAVLGSLVDASFSATGLFSFSNNVLLPAWLVVLWMGFATTLNRCLAILNKPGKAQVLFASLVGAVGGPLSYLAGERLGAVTFDSGLTATMTAVALAWAFLLPALMALSRHLDVYFLPAAEPANTDRTSRPLSREETP